MPGRTLGNDATFTSCSVLDSGLSMMWFRLKKMDLVKISYSYHGFFILCVEKYNVAAGVVGRDAICRTIAEQ